jgi:hypothetical protein
MKELDSAYQQGNNINIPMKKDIIFSNKIGGDFALSGIKNVRI